MAKKEQTLAAFLVQDGKAARRFLTEVQRIDKADKNVKVVDAAIADRGKRRGGVKVHQTHDIGGARGAAGGTALGVVVGTILLGPAGPLVGGALGGTLGGLYSRFRDIGLDDKFMKGVAKEIEKGKSALFVLYEGEWAASIGAIQDLVKAEHAELLQSTMAAEKADALRALVAPAVEQLGGEEAVEDFEVEPEAEAAPAEAAAAADDLTRISGIDGGTAAVLGAAGVATYAQLASTSEPDARRILGTANAAVPDNVGTWAMQASFAANGDWPGLDAFLRASQPEPAAAAPAAVPDDLTQLSGIGPKAAEALGGAGIATYAALAQANEPTIRRALHDADMTPPAGIGTWPMQASYATRGDWQGLMKYNEKHARPAASHARPAAATAAAAAPPDDLTQLKGIGPRMASLLNDNEITTYADLQHESTEHLRQVVAQSGALPPASLDTWPTQASYASKGDWSGLSTYNNRH